jgi:DNA transposition AAA+ family ATPase
MITKELQQRILEALKQSRENFTGSDGKFSVSIGINAAQYSRIKNGDTEKVLSEAQWISLARRLGVSPANAPEWKTANTPVFRFITTQLELCRSTSTSALLCDLSDIGKTYTAVHYAKTHRNVIYVDCSQVKTKQKLVRYIAKEFGVGGTGCYPDVYENLVFYLKTLPAPLIILDEAGDLEYSAFLEIKALWNATELSCGWYMMGADGLKEKIRRAIDGKKVGYTEIFSRFGKRYGKFVPTSKEECEKMLQASAAMIIRANSPEADINKLLRSTMGEDNVPSLRRIYKELEKMA